MGASSDTTISSVGSPVRRQTAVTIQPRRTPTAIPPKTDDDERHARVERRERAEDDGRDGDAVEDEGRGVVDQALALQDRDDPAGHAQAAQHGRRRDGVRRGHDRPQRERRRPLELLDEQARDEPDGDRREQHEPDRELADGPDVRLEVPDGRAERGPEQDRRQEQQEDQLGRQLDGRGVGQLGEEQPQAQPAEDEQDRVGDPDPPGDVRQRDREGEQDQDEFDDLLGGHRRRLGLRRWAVAARVSAERRRRERGTRPARLPRLEAVELDGVDRVGRLEAEDLAEERQLGLLGPADGAPRRGSRGPRPRTAGSRAGCDWPRAPRRSPRTGSAGRPGRRRPGGSGPGS